MTRHSINRGKLPCTRGCEHPADSLERIVSDFISQHRCRANLEMRWYASQPNLGAAICVATLSKTSEGKRHPHQYRIPQQALERARCRLTANFREAASFHELWEIVDLESGGIHRIGELAVYDISHRLGAFLGLRPDNVYLHAGARAGAKCLGIMSGRFVSRGGLPSQLQRLSSAEIEDCLCIYKKELAVYKAALRDHEPP